MYGAVGIHGASTSFPTPNLTLTSLHITENDGGEKNEETQGKNFDQIAPNKLDSK